MSQDIQNFSLGGYKAAPAMTPTSTSKHQKSYTYIVVCVIYSFGNT